MMIKRRGKERLCYNLGNRKGRVCEAVEGWGGGGDGKHVKRKREILFQKDEMKNKVMGREGA